MSAPSTSDGKGSFVGNFLNNIELSGRTPGKSLIGFVVAWVAFFIILWAMPTPEGLTVAGKATLAVVVWACIMWITEAIPPGIAGILIPMLLVLGGATDKFPKAASGFTTPVVFLCLAAFLFAAVMQAAGLDKRIALS
ncbi:MAG: anion permease, partial [Gammaproteobacteria bacterium]|nr:anion permease [Gammaproteobacteria bacterium]